MLLIWLPTEIVYLVLLSHISSVWSYGSAGENPLTPLWLVVEEVFALMLMAHILHNKILFLFLLIICFIIFYDAITSAFR